MALTAQKGLRTTPAILFGLLVFSSAMCSAALGKKGGNGKPKQSPPLYEAGAVELRGDAGDALAGDGLGPYIDGQDGVECIHDPTGVLECVTSPLRLVNLSLGTCISDSCEDPFGGAWGGAIVAWFQENRFYMDGQDAWPGIGETLVSNSSGFNQGGMYFNFLVGDQAYWIIWKGPNGDISATGFDDDADGQLDRVVMTASETATARLLKVVEVTTTKGNGKKTFTTTDHVFIGEFVDMPFQATFYSLGYEREKPVGLY